MQWQRKLSEPFLLLQPLHSHRSSLMCSWLCWKKNKPDWLKSQPSGYSYIVCIGSPALLGGAPALHRLQWLSKGHMASSGLAHLLVASKLEGHQLEVPRFPSVPFESMIGKFGVLRMVVLRSQCWKSICLCHIHQMKFWQTPALEECVARRGGGPWPSYHLSTDFESLDN